MSPGRPAGEPASGAEAAAIAVLPSGEGLSDRLLDAFGEAASHTDGAVDRTFTIAGYPIAVRFASSQLAGALTPALAHLPPTTEPSALTVHVWDSATTRSPLPPLRFSPEAIPWHPDRTRKESRSIWVAGSLDLSVSALDAARSLGFFWSVDAGRLPHWERGSPLLHVLHWWLATRGLQLVHGGAVGTPGAGVFLAGKGGSGKSSTALACVRSGMRYAADDYALLQVHPSPFVHSLYNSAKVALPDMVRFPEVFPPNTPLTGEPNEKAVAFLGEIWPERVSLGFPIAAVLVPRVGTGKRSRLMPVSGRVGLVALAPSTIFQLAGAGEPTLARLGRLVEQVPCYVLELGSDPGHVADLIGSILTGPAGS